MALTPYTFSQLIDFSRTSSATYVNSSGFITVTPISKNLLTYTQDFDNAAWTKSGTTVSANTTTAPDGTGTADTLTESATTAVHNTQRSATLTASSTYTLSVYAKAKGRRYLTVALNQNNAVLATFDLQAGTVTGAATAIGTGWSGASAAITDAGNGWYRCAVTGTDSVGGSRTMFFDLNNVSTNPAAGNGTSYAGDGTSGVYLWGAQLEAAAGATSYTKNFGGLYPPRFDYDPVTKVARGFLIENVSTNVLTYSEQFDNAAWSKTNVTVTANAVVSPDGTTDADKIEAATAAATSISNSAAVTATAATLTVYVKQGSGATAANVFKVRNTTTSTDLLAGTFNYATGQWTYTTGTTGLSAQDAGNGWWRVQLTATSGITSGDTIAAYVGFDGTSAAAGAYLYAWGAQLEGYRYPTTYIPTTSSSATRAADGARINAPMFAPWYNSAGGTIVAEIDSSTVASNTPYAYAISDGTTNENITLNVTSSGASFTATITTGGVAQLSSAVSVAYAAGTVYKVGIAATSNSAIAAVNGTLGAEDTSVTMPTVTSLRLGATATGSSQLVGHLRSLVYYPTRVTNAQLQALTS